MTFSVKVQENRENTRDFILSRTYDSTYLTNSLGKFIVRTFFSTNYLSTIYNEGKYGRLKRRQPI